ncbi:MAG: 4Fe-4S dicluster domain-containing protein [Candidatus Lokiarchaeota archaeon]|nr:4Fe-4S dicluster domain-containing protein [Candidatus Lokiarchaeota archaeon]MBD3340390.1 4Fe-4S dicluster domain-containing protein [Candidatus Lokiarchaeota archaeon]
MRKASEIYELKKKNYQRFPEQNHCIYRSLYDPEFKHYHKTLRTGMTSLVDSNKEGFERKDLALAAASWTINKHMSFAFEHFPEHNPQDYIPEEVRKRPPKEIPKEDITQYTKKAAKFFGASKVGITNLDTNWVYSNKVELYSTSIHEKQEDLEFPEIKLPDGVNKAIVIAIEMDKYGIACAPNFIEFAAAGLGYSKISFIISCLAQFIRNLGYIALPCANGTALSVPLAIDAGLGALGRIGVLITKEYGPRIRLCKVLTNMPLVEDHPDVEFIKEVNSRCENCLKCAEACEKDAISFEKSRNYNVRCKSNSPGSKKWYVDVEKCYEGWVEYSSDCAKCIAACPYSKVPSNFNPEEFWKS